MSGIFEVALSGKKTFDMKYSGGFIHRADVYS